MDTNTVKSAKRRYGSFLTLIADTDVFFREMILAFYGLYMVFFLAYNVWDEHRTVVLAYQAVSAVCAPGLFFALGWLVSAIAGQHRSPKQRRSAYLGYAALSYIYYALIGIALHVFAYGEECFKTIKNILFAILIPASGGIFLTIAFVLLSFALFEDRLRAICDSPGWRIALCAVGLLMTLLPGRLVGYGLFGIIIGSDTAGAVPFFFYLIAFFAGMDEKNRRKSAETSSAGDPEGSTVSGDKGTGKKNSILTKKDWIMAVCLLAAGAFFLAAGLLQQTGLVLLGTGAALFAVFILNLLRPVYIFLEGIFLRIFHPLYDVWTRERKKVVPGSRSYIAWYYVFYACLFVLISFLIFVPYINGGYSLIWESDGLGQYVPKAYRFVKDMPGVISSLLHGSTDFKQYDFGVGLGSPMTFSFDPVYWLYMVTGIRHIEWTYNLAVILRYFMAGAAMSCLILYLRKSWRMAAVGSFAYIYSGYAIFAGTRHSQFITPLILFPLIVVAMERLIRHRKWFLMTILVAVSLFCSYYFLYMNTIAIGIYFILRILLTKEYRSLRTFFNRGLIITGSYMLGASIAFISLVTSFGGYLGSSRSGGSAVSSLITNNTLFYRSEWLIDIAAALTSVDFGPGQWLRIGMVPAVLFALVLLFCRKNRPELRYSFIVCVIFCIFPIFGYIMSGFSSVTNRWAYIFTAVLAIILALNLDRLTRLTRKEIRIMTGLAGGYGLLMCLGLKFHTTGIQGSLALLAFTITLILFLNLEREKMKVRTARMILFAFILFTVVMNGNFFITRVGTDTGGSHLETYVPAGKADSYLKATALKHLKEVPGYDDKDFFRSDNLRNTSLTRNSSMVVPYKSVSTFTSTLPGSIVNYNREMGSNAWNIVTVYDYNFRTYMNELASVRYLGKEASSKATMPYGYHKVLEKESPTSTYEIYENEYALPAGYCYDQVVAASEVEDLDALTKQELTMQAAITADQDMAMITGSEGMTAGQTSAETAGQASGQAAADGLVPKAKLEDLTASITTKEVPIQDMKVSSGMTWDEKEGLLTIEDIEDARLTFSFDALPDSETYLVIRGDVVPVDDSREIEINTQCKAAGVNYSARFRLDNYSTGQQEYVYNLGYHKDAIKKCFLYFEDEGQLKIDSFRICSLPMAGYKDRVEALKAESLTHVRQKGNELSGDITLSKNKVLVISLPYQSGWTAYVDGKKANISQVNYQYMGLALTKGSHKIRMVYQIPGIRLGFIISGAGILLFILIIIGNHLRKKLTK